MATSPTTDERLSRYIERRLAEFSAEHGLTLSGPESRRLAYLLGQADALFCSGILRATLPMVPDWSDGD